VVAQLRLDRVGDLVRLQGEGGVAEGVEEVAPEGEVVEVAAVGGRPVGVVLRVLVCRLAEVELAVGDLLLDVDQLLPGRLAGLLGGVRGDLDEDVAGLDLRAGEEVVALLEVVAEGLVAGLGGQVFRPTEAQAELVAEGGGADVNAGRNEARSPPCSLCARFLLILSSSASMSVSATAIFCASRKRASRTRLTKASRAAR
jgi:hypothetical protein